MSCAGSISTFCCRMVLATGQTDKKDKRSSSFEVILKFCSYPSKSRDRWRWYQSKSRSGQKVKLSTLLLYLYNTISFIDIQSTSPSHLLWIISGTGLRKCFAYTFRERESQIWSQAESFSNLPNPRCLGSLNTFCSPENIIILITHRLYYLAKPGHQARNPFSYFCLISAFFIIWSILQRPRHLFFRKAKLYITISVVDYECIAAKPSCIP